MELKKIRRRGGQFFDEFYPAIKELEASFCIIVSLHERATTTKRGVFALWPNSLASIRS